MMIFCISLCFQRIFRCKCFGEQCIALCAVRAHIRCKDTVTAIAPFIYGSTCAVSKQTADSAVCLINQMAQNLCTYNKDTFCLSAAQEAVCHIRSINKSGAGCGQIKGKGMGCSQLCL